MTDNFLHTPAEMMKDYVQWAEDAKENPGIQFGIPSIDKVMVPMRPGNFVAIIARPAMMKTTLLAILARNEAGRIIARGTQDKECVVFVTWEQSAEELTNFFLADGDYSASEVAWGEVPLENIKKKAIKGVHKPIWIIGHGIARAGKVNTPRMYPEAVLKSIETIEEKYHRKPTLLLFDYLQLIPVQYAKDRVQQVTEIPHRIKEVALRVGAPAVAAVQARQEVDDRKLKMPTMRDGQWACLAGDVELMNADTGQCCAAEEVWGAGEDFPIHALNSNTLKIERVTINASMKNDPETIYKLSCNGGATIRANARHPFFTTGGWKRLDALATGEFVAIAKQLPISGNSDITPEQAFVIGSLLGDGTVVRALTLSNSDKEILDAFRVAIETEWPNYTTSVRKQSNWNVWDSTVRRADRRVFPGGNKVLNWAKEIGLWGQRAEGKHIPNLKMDNAARAAMLAGLFATDGCLSIRNDCPQLGFCGVSKELVQGTGYLLSCLGIDWTIRQQKGGNRKKLLYVLRVSACDLPLFDNLIKFPGKKGRKLHTFLQAHPTLRGRSMGDLLPPAWTKEARAKAKEQYVPSRHRSRQGPTMTRGMMKILAQETGDEQLARYASCNIAWRKIVSIEENGVEPTYDFQVPSFHNFVANRFVVHNSSIGQTADKVFSLWYPYKTEEPGSQLKISGNTYTVTEDLLLMQFLKQRFAAGSGIYSFSIDPARLTLKELVTATKSIGR